MKQDSRDKPEGREAQEQETLARRDFLVGIAKWSGAVIGGIALGGVLRPPESEAARGSWVNRRGGGGWANVRGGGGGWANVVGGGWHNVGGTWANVVGGGGGWVNRRGGGGWLNVR